MGENIESACMHLCACFEGVNHGPDHVILAQN